MTDDVDDRALAQLRAMSRGLTGKADYRLEVALAVHQLQHENFRPNEVLEMMVSPGAASSSNIVRNLQALVEAGLLQQAAAGAPYHKDVRHPFWGFIGDTWTILRASVRSSEAAESVLTEAARRRALLAELTTSSAMEADPPADQ